ncbi:MAG: hypothetical protein V3U37_00765 [Nitrospinaceae bacterium]
MKRYLSLGVLVMFLGGLVIGAVGCAAHGDKSSESYSKKSGSSYEEERKREGS